MSDIDAPEGEVAKPPPAQTLFAAAVGGFVGAVVGVVVAGTMSGDGNNGNDEQTSIGTTDTEVVEVLVAKD